MEPGRPESAPFRLGEWVVHPAAGTLESGGVTRRLEPQVMDLLVLLASRPGEVFTKQQILEVVWQGRFVGEDSLTGAVSQLRKALGDESRRPRYVETIPKRGYRMLASRGDGGAGGAAAPTRRPGRRWRRAAAAGVLLAGLVAAAAGWLGARSRPPAVRSLAVLPLRSLSPDPRDAALADGLTAALITELARLSPLRVISHTSVLGYRDSRKTVPEIARELHVEAVLEGSVAREGNRVRVDAQLVSAPRETHLWAESYDRDLGDALQLQAEIARSVARGIRLRLAGGGRAEMRPQPVAPAAVEAYLRGRALLDPRAPEGLRQARVYFEQATRLEPAFAEAFAARAEASVLMIDHGLPAETSVQARADALRALRLDPNLAEARVSHAAILALLDWDLPGSERELRRALALQPSLAKAHRSYAYVLSALGRHEEAVREAREALALDPLHLPTHWDAAEILLLARRYDDVLGQMGRALELDPGAATAHYQIAFARWFQGREREAYAAYRRGLECEGLTREVLEGLDDIFSRDGLRGVFRSVAGYLESQPVQTPSLRRHVGIYYAAAGEEGRALAILEEGYRERSPAMLWVAVSPHLDPLRSHPRFKDLVSRLPFLRPRP